MMVNNTPILISSLPPEEQAKILANIESSECSRCGCKGLHACTGEPIVWTPADIERLDKALADMFGWKKEDVK